MLVLTHARTHTSTHTRAHTHKLSHSRTMAHQLRQCAGACKREHVCVSMCVCVCVCVCVYRYKVSWKADGTRYLLLIMNQGCYLINRSYKIVRLQVHTHTHTCTHTVLPTCSKEPSWGLSSHNNIHTMILYEACAAPFWGGT